MAPSFFTCRFCLPFPPFARHFLMAEPAPYGGLLTQTLQDEKDQQAKLQKQAVTVTVAGTPETIRPEAVHLSGVDSLSTDNIKSYVDYYVNYDITEADEPVYQQLPYDQQTQFRVQWVNDTSVNLVCKTHADAAAMLTKLLVTPGAPTLDAEADMAMDEVPDELTEEYVSQLVQEREAKPYSAIDRFQKTISLASRLGAGGENEDDAPRTVELYVRLAFETDRKVKNAAAQSRYYLFHGEPDRSRQLYRQRERRKDGRAERRDRDDDREGGNGARRKKRNRAEPDLFADRLEHKSRADETDLFADRMRERSPTRGD